MLKQKKNETAPLDTKKALEKNSKQPFAHQVVIVKAGKDEMIRREGSLANAYKNPLTTTYKIIEMSHQKHDDIQFEEKVLIKLSDMLYEEKENEFAKDFSNWVKLTQMEIASESKAHIGEAKSTINEKYKKIVEANEGKFDSNTNK